MQLNCKWTKAEKGNINGDRTVECAMRMEEKKIGNNDMRKKNY